SSQAAAARDAVARASLDGLEPLVAELVGAIGGAAAVVAADGRELAGAGSRSQWRPPREHDGGAQPGLVHPRPGGGRTVAAPASLGGETLAWVVSQDADTDGAVVRAAVEHAALLAASVVLRERTALEVEMRMRGGFVDDLCARREPDATLVARAATLGLDLTEPSRVLLVERSANSVEEPRLYDVVADCARAWPKGALVAAPGPGIAVGFGQ